MVNGFDRRTSGGFLRIAEHTGSQIEVRVAMVRATSWETYVDLRVGPGEDVTNAVLSARSILDR